ncbi:hypothetical protein [Gloeocapsopsis dulcis]|uniref:Uncharacterized protein n=1 Tax=Gloeocapsopsis dulcis AAB1 = 1H9 TaxID=1433147 RepID=A0A6N8FUC8_9CHRO|nr:hypothetical protein [Gloeocapsopsis dulcis]MUL35546.1 hypothetical protein [Gloeocapsopsis dulcis AAB1 = 1H9]WNN87556.1 hypothetical protein P0S91_14620 [Gloeocapsopsis dulcis]
MTTQVDKELQQKVDHSIDQAKEILFKTTERLQTTTQQAKDTLTETSGKAVKAVDIQSAIATSTSNWLQDHPAILRLVQILIWATEHPIISLIVLLFVIAIAWSLIKSIGRLIDKIASSLLQAPLKLLQTLLIFIISTLGNLGISLNKPAEQLALQQGSTIVIKDKSQQIAEISTRLEALQQEQNELLKALMEILASDETQENIYEQHPSSFTN